MNEHLSSIAEGDQRVIRYTSANGQSLLGLLVYPVDYQEGTRYPLITTVYPGTLITPEGHARSRIDYPSPQHNVQLLPARGYAVLFPSIPLPGGSNPLHPLFEIAGHVHPAIDQAIEMGVADPERLAVYGHSYGSYAVLALVSQSRRFRAAVVSAVYSNLFGRYSEFAATRRPPSNALELHQRAIAELEGPYTLRMGAPPWSDPTRYVLNSPVFHVHRIDVPLLMLHGELDAVPMAQSEAMLIGLNRLGRRARLVRYWGEAHNFDSPENIRDVWEQVLTWFDEYLANCSTCHSQ